MANRSPEQDLINSFVAALLSHEDERLSISVIHNQNCKSKTLADIEFESKSGIRWVVEAKSHDSGDRYNTVHKIFGELMKETGRKNREGCKHALLIPEEATVFYSRAFQSINRDKFVAFGRLIPIETVFTFGHNGVGEISWAALYDVHGP